MTASLSATDLEKIRMLAYSSATVTLPDEIVLALVDGQQPPAAPTRYAVGDPVRIDPQRCGVIGARGVITQVWPGGGRQETVYEVLVTNAESVHLYRESELRV
jgi:hypothetical protein